MSRRHMKKLEALRAEQQSPQITKEDEEESEDVDCVPAEVPTVARNRFGLLLEGSDDGADASEEDNEPAKSNSAGRWGQEGDEEAGEEGDQSLHSPADAVRCKIKKKKKKKKNKVVKADTTDASEEHEVDEVEACVREVNALLGEATVAGAGGGGEQQKDAGSLGSSQRNHLLSVDYKFMDAKTELQRMFGSDAVLPDTGASSRSQRRFRLMPRGHGRPRGGTKASLTGGEQHSTFYDNGMTMVTDADHRVCGQDGMTVYRYVHDFKYQVHQHKFDHALDARDQQGILELMHTRPHHIDTLLQLAGMFRSQEDFTYADDLVQKAVLELEHSMTSCRLTDVHSSFDYTRMENRGLFFGLFYHMLSVGRRRCFRAALELCKILMRLSADNDDPLAASLVVDFYALRAQEYIWLLEYYTEYNPRKNLAMLPNFAYSIPLAYFYVSSGLGNTICHKALRQSLQEACSDRYSDKALLRAHADELLDQALFSFPEVFKCLLETNGIRPNDDISKSDHFYGISRTPLNAIFNLYATRLAPLWKEPEVLEWLMERAACCLVRVTVSAPCVAAARRRRLASYPVATLPVPVQRHLVLAGSPDVHEYLSPFVLAEAQWRHHDLIPPPSSRRSYQNVRLTGHGRLRPGDDASQQPPATTARGILADFFATLLPDAVTGAAAANNQGFGYAGGDLIQLHNPVQMGEAPAAVGAAAAAGGAAAALGGAAPDVAGAAAVVDAPAGAVGPGLAAVQSIRFFLDSARALLDATLFRVREGDEGGDEADRWPGEGESEEEEEGSLSRREDDFNEDQEQI